MRRRDYIYDFLASENFRFENAKNIFFEILMFLWWHILTNKKVFQDVEIMNSLYLNWLLRGFITQHDLSLNISKWAETFSSNLC